MLALLVALVLRIGGSSRGLTPAIIVVILVPVIIPFQ